MHEEARGKFQISSTIEERGGARTPIKIIVMKHNVVV